MKSRKLMANSLVGNFKVYRSLLTFSGIASGRKAPLSFEEEASEILNQNSLSSKLTLPNRPLCTFRYIFGASHFNRLTRSLIQKLKLDSFIHHFFSFRCIFMHSLRLLGKWRLPSKHHLAVLT